MIVKGPFKDHLKSIIGESTWVVLNDPPTFEPPTLYCRALKCSFEVCVFILGKNPGILYLPPMIKFGNLKFNFGIGGSQLAKCSKEHSRSDEECKILSNHKIEGMFYIYSWLEEARHRM